MEGGQPRKLRLELSQVLNDGGDVGRWGGRAACPEVIEVQPLDRGEAGLTRASCPLTISM